MIVPEDITELERSSLVSLQQQVEKRMTELRAQKTMAKTEEAHRRIRTEYDLLVAAKERVVREFSRRKSASGFLLTLEMEDRRFYHAIREPVDIWMADMLVTMGRDSPVLLCYICLSADVMEKLPKELFEMPEQ